MTDNEIDVAERAPRWGSRHRASALVAGAALLVAGVVCGNTLISSAMLSSRASTATASITSGTIALALSGGTASGTWTGSFSVTPGGDSHYARIVVNNNGSAPLRYAVRATATSGTLAPHLNLAIARLATSATACDSSTFAAGTVVSNDPVSPATALPFGATGGINVIGDPTTGAQRGDLRLGAQSADARCMKVDFQLGNGAGHDGVGARAVTTFAFSGESL